MADVFVSYLREDKERVQPVVSLLEAAGCSVWFDIRIGAGEHFDEVIERELRAAKCVVVFWSIKSVNSRWVRTEAAEGWTRNCLIPVLLDNVRPPLQFRLVQAIDLTQWSGKEHTARELVDAVSRLAGRKDREKGSDVRYELDITPDEARYGATKQLSFPGGAIVDLNIPAGTTNGVVLRLKGKGRPSIGGAHVGDALVKLVINSAIADKHVVRQSTSRYRFDEVSNPAAHAGITNYFSFKDRSTRSAYWYFVLFLCIGLIITSADATINTIFIWAMVIPSLAFSVRRLHDTNRSGWWVLLGLIPIIGWIILVVWACEPSDPRTNEHGRPPAV